MAPANPPIPVTTKMTVNLKAPHFSRGRAALPLPATPCQEGPSPRRRDHVHFTDVETGWGRLGSPRACQCGASLNPGLPGAAELLLSDAVSSTAREFALPALFTHSPRTVGI